MKEKIWLQKYGKRQRTAAALIYLCKDFTLIGIHPIRQELRLLGIVGGEKERLPGGVLL